MFVDPGNIDRPDNDVSIVLDNRYVYLMITCVFDHLSGSINIVFRTSIVFSWSIHHRLIFVPVRIGNGFTNLTNDSNQCLPGISIVTFVLVLVIE